MIRECGTCASCCTVLGIKEIDKPKGEPCPALQEGEERCSFYDIRPHACRDFQCEWLAGVGEDDHRPDTSGVLLFPPPRDQVSIGIRMIQCFAVWEGAFDSALWRELEKGLTSLGYALLLIPHGGAEDLLLPRTLKGNKDALTRARRYMTLTLANQHSN